MIAVAQRPAFLALRKPTLRAARVVRAQDPRNAARDAAKQGQETLQDTIIEAKDKFVEATMENSGLNPAVTGTQPGNDSQYGEVAETMNFSGPLPEIINCRLAMLGVLTAWVSEFKSGNTIFEQIQNRPAIIAGVFLTIIIASIVPVVRNAKLDVSSGPFTPKAERWNGRLAMIAFVLMIAEETWRRAPQWPISMFH